MKPRQFKRYKQMKLSTKGEFEPLSSLLIGHMRSDEQTDSSGHGLPVTADLKLATDEQKDDCTLLVGSEFLGRGDDALGAELMHKYFRALLHQSQVPLHIVFLNSAVKLCSEDSPIKRQLTALKEMGCAVHADTTSLEHYKVDIPACLATPINSIGLAQLILESPRVITLP